MSAHSHSRSSRQRGQPLPLPSFSFPAAAPETAPSSSTMEPLATTHTSEPVLAVAPASKRQHRRTNAVSNSLLSRAPVPRPLTVAVPPVPTIPAIYRSSQTPTSQPMSRQQLSARSMSDVSSCPTLETDSGLNSPEPFVLDSAPAFDYFSIRPRKSQGTQNVELASSPAAESDSTVNGIAEEQEYDDDSDDDEEFWHCRGVPDCLLESRKPSLTAELDDNEDTIGIDIGAWAKSLESFSFPEVPSTLSKDFDNESYMDLMRHPLMATSWLGN